MSLGTIEVVVFDLGDTLVQDDAQWVPGARDALHDLGTAGVRLGVISNTGNLDRNALRARLPPTFDIGVFEPQLVILSSEVGIEKPDLAIFRLAKTRAGLQAGAILFCSESPLDVLAAQRTGMGGLRLRPPPHGDVRDVPGLLTRVKALV